MSRYWDDLNCPRCGVPINPINIELAYRRDNYTVQHGSERHFYYNCSCNRQVVIHLFTEDKKEGKLYV